ncbi:MAG: hypothetical protein MI745_03970 [Pseudomonadales bacterium]|nr:hypothetical protein [Pseudomonadales bacterium]
MTQRLFVFLCLLLPLACHGAGLQGSLQTQWHSRYISEGRDNLDGDSLTSLGGDLGRMDAAFGVWQAWGNGSDYRENNLFVEYAPYLGDWNPYVNLTYLQFHPDDPDDLEAGLGVANHIQPWLTVALDGVWSKQADGAFYALSLISEREIVPQWVGQLRLTQTYDDGYASEHYDGPNHRELGVMLTWACHSAVNLWAGWQHSWAGEDVRRDGGDDLSWGQIGVMTYF